MARDLQIYRNKVRISGETKDKLLYAANEMGVQPDEAFNRLIDMGYQLWLADSEQTERPIRQRPS